MPNLAFDVIWRDRGAERGMRNLGDTTERTHKRFSALKVTALAALGAAAVGAVKFGGASVRAYVEAETAQAKLQNAYAKFPRLADTQIGALQRLNTELAKKTRFDDDATASGQAVLAQFNLTGQQITRLTPLLQDYAAKTGKDLPTAARDLGKAMLGQGRSLKQVGINFKDTGSAGGNFDQIMRGLRTQVGGFAEVEGKTAAGQAEILRNQFGELQEAAGAKLLPALMKVGQGLLSVVTYVQDSNGVFGSFKRIATATFSAFTESVGLGRASFRGFADFVSTHQADIVSAFVTGGKVVLGFAGVLATMASGGLRALGGLMDGFGTMTSVVIGTLRNLTKGAAIAFGWIPGVGAKLRAADATFGAFADTAVNGFRNTGNKAREAADQIDTKLRPAIAASGKKLDEHGRKEVWSAKQRDAANRARIALNAIGTAADGSQIKLKTWNERTRLGSVAQRALEDRIRAARTRMLEQRDAGIKAGDSQAALTRRWNQGREALYREFRQMGLSKEEAKRLATAYSKVPKKAETKVTQPGMKGARSDTKDLDSRINNLNSKTVSINYKTNAGRLANAFKLGLTLNSGEQKGGSRSQVGSQAGGATLSHGHGPESGGPGITRTLSTPIHGRPNAPRFDTLTNRLGRGIGARLGAQIGAKLDAIEPSSSGAPGGRVAIRPGSGWGAIQAAMRRHGARTFNTYPGHHPSMARARDVYPHNWAAANAARALAGVWYVIYRMKIASKNHGNVWRPYRPTNFRGDWRHVRHIHVARYDQGGPLRPGLTLAYNGTGRNERVVTASGRGAAGNVYHITINAPIGAQADLRNNLMQMATRGDLDVIVKKAVRA